MVRKISMKDVRKHIRCIYDYALKPISRTCWAGPKCVGNQRTIADTRSVQ